MRIISGLYKSRKITGDKIEGTRPTMDRVKESLFAMIQEYIKNSIVLDLFAGSGALGLEALSNGASFCYFNDINKKCLKAINDNIKDLKVENISQIMELDYMRALEYFSKNNIKFNIIFLDPPYNEKVINNIINYIIDNNLLIKNGLIIAEVNYDYINNINFKIYKKRTFSDKKIIIIQK